MKRHRSTGTLVALTTLALSALLAPDMAAAAGAVAERVPEEGSVTTPDQKALFDTLNAMIGHRPDDAVARTEFTLADRAAIVQANADNTPLDPLQIGLVKPLGVAIDLTTLPVAEIGDRHAHFQGGLARRAGDHLVWTINLEAQSAGSVRLRFEDVHLPAGAELFVYNSEGDVRGPYTGDRDLFWSHSLRGGELYVQVNQPYDAARAQPTLRISGILLIDNAAPGTCPEPLNCVENAACFDERDWDALDAARGGIANINFVDGDGGYVCSGGLLNDSDPGTRVPYFLTANRCVGTAAIAASVEARFAYRTADCHAGCPWPGQPGLLGATLLDTSQIQGHTLLRLNADPPAGTWLLGWTTDAVANTQALPLYRLSHPSGGPLAYSTHLVDTTISPFLYCTAEATSTDGLPRGPEATNTNDFPRGRFIFSRDTIVNGANDLIGGIDPGSLGAPVMIASGQVVGQLDGICGENSNGACYPDKQERLVARDSAFADYYYRIVQWLNPNPTQWSALNVRKIGTGGGTLVSTVLDSPPVPPLPVPDTAPVAPARDGAWPWQAALTIDTWLVDKWYCGGAVIDAKWIITAAHCIEDDAGVTVAPATVTARTGSNSFDYGGHRSEVKRIIKHPRYERATLDYDIALLELKERIPEHAVRPLTIAREGTLAGAGTQATVTGWGANRVARQDTSDLAPVLQQARMPLLAWADCPAQATDRMICTGPAPGAEDVCDSGGPLVVANGQGGFVLAGLIGNIGRGCASVETKGVHTRLASHVGWLEEQTGLDLTSPLDLTNGIIDCGTTCETRLATGSRVRLTAIPDAYSVFARWEGGCTGTVNPCELSLSQSRDVKAVFNLQQPVGVGGN